MKVSIIIPTLNEEKTIVNVLNKVEAVDLGKIKKEIIVVDDKSTDRTWKLEKNQAGKHSNIKAIQRKSSIKGKSISIQEGLKHAKGDIIIVQDADLEYDPNDYSVLIKPILEGNAKVVYGSRFLKKIWPDKMHLSNFLANKILVFIANFLYNGNISDEATAYKVFKSDVLKKIKLKSIRFDFCPEVTAKVLKKGLKIYDVPISYSARVKKEGKKVGLKDGLIAVWTLIKYRFID